MAFLKVFSDTENTVKDLAQDLQKKPHKAVQGDEDYHQHLQKPLPMEAA